MEAIEELLAQGVDYEDDDALYCEMSQEPKDGEHSKRKVEKMKSGAVVEVRSENGHPRDFALLKRAEP